MKTDLSRYDNSWYDTGAGALKRILWYYANEIFFDCGWNVFNGMKIRLLRLFGARVGTGVVIKPKVNIKYPWNLSVGNNVWIGEGVWIDNLAATYIGDNAVISQGSMLLCGNHDYKKSTFDLVVSGITVDEGAWVGAKCVVCPGVTVNSHSVICVGSVITKDTEPYCIYQGVPARFIKERNILE